MNFTRSLVLRNTIRFSDFSALYYPVGGKMVRKEIWE